MGKDDLLIDVDRNRYREWLSEQEKNDCWESIKAFRETIYNRRPLLLLYPINKDFMPPTFMQSYQEGNDEIDWLRRNIGKRVPLFFGVDKSKTEPTDILGVGIVFPSTNREDIRNDNCVRLRLETRDENGEEFDDIDLIETDDQEINERQVL